MFKKTFYLQSNKDKLHQIYGNISINKKISSFFPFIDETWVEYLFPNFPACDAYQRFR